MGFFAHAYVIEAAPLGSDVSIKITAYSHNGPAFFLWGPGIRQPGIMSLADETLFCAAKLQVLPGYPRVDYRSGGDDDAAEEIYVEESFFPYRQDEPVLFHVLLPPRYVLMPHRTPFTLSSGANIALKNDRLFFTWPKVGGGDLRFWMRRLRPNENFSEFELGRLLQAPVARRPNIKFGLNLGVISLEVGGSA